ncbi:hypothetical protein NQD34_003909 [Periophthalmus magnuspinnatus]|nr:hypothetical protein NQD34_003909 [Periophthalmus magnuspinnatus]
MVSGHSMEILLESTFGRRMPSFNETVAPNGQSQVPPSGSRFMGKPFTGAYFSFIPPGKDLGSYPVPWTSAESLDRESPVTHSSATDQQHIYRRDGSSNESHLEYTGSGIKPGFTLYSDSPGVSGSENAASVIVRKSPVGADTVSSDRPVYLAVPQAVYTQSSCCSDLCCVLGHGSKHRAYESCWKHREPSDPPHRPSEAVSLPAALRQTYSSTNMKEVNHSLQCSPRAYPRLYPSQAAYEPAVFHSTSPISKYGHAAQHPVFYCSPVSVEVEQRTETQNTGSMNADEVPVILKHSIQTAGNHYIVPTPLHGDMSLHRRELMPNPTFLHGSEYPGYFIPRLSLNTRSIHGHRHPRTAPHDFTNPSPKHVHRPVATLASGYRDKCAQHTEPPSSSVCVEQTSPTTCIRTCTAATSAQAQNKYGPPKNTVYMSPLGERIHRAPPPPLPPTQPPAHSDLGVHPSRYHAYHVRPQPNQLTIPPLPHAILSKKTNAQKILYCPPLQNPSTPQLAHTHEHTGPVKRALPVSSISITEDDDDDDVFVVEPDLKRQKPDLGNSKDKSADISSPMPVINNVFSLAPYQTYLQMSRLLLGSLRQGPAHPSSNQSRAQRSNEDVKPQFLLSKAVNMSRTKTLHRYKEHTGLCEDKKSDTRVTKKEENPVQQMGFSNNVKLTKHPSEVKIKQECSYELIHMSPAAPEPAPLHHTKVKQNQPDTETKQIIPSPSFPERVGFLNIPPHHLKLSTYNIIAPDIHFPRVVQKPVSSPEPQNTQPPLASAPLQMPARKHFFELHQSLVKLISKSVAAASEDTLRSWLSQMELSHVPASKNQKVRCLFGAKGRNACLNEEMKSSLQDIYQRLNEYSQDHCPFPFVMRTGAIFLPMLVVKEVLFPSVHGGLIDQVLQEHKVELRPTTLSEEKALIQMNKRACSSRLRKLMSYKHLPLVYADVVNLLYYTCVCKQLGLEMEDRLDAEADECCAGPSSSQSSPVSLPPPPDDSEELETKSLLKRRSCIKTSSRRLFDCSSDEEDQNDSKPGSNPTQQADVCDGVDQSWMCPLTSEELSVDGGGSTLRKSKNGSGVILKLRRLFDRKRTSYRPVLDSDKKHLEPRPSDPDAQEVSTEPVRRAPEVARWRRNTFSNSLRPLNIYSKRKLRSLLTIKYCPYLSACHSTDYRRRRVLRSAVHRARQVMKTYYPDLVGKRIQHLYEEDDKSEVWYRGEVLQIHKAHPNPLKTVFEVQYETEPEWKYYLELLIDYKKGWLKIDD